VSDQSEPQWEGRLAISVLVLLLASLLWRVRFGVDFTDESFYVALPYRFALGDTPFVDELNVVQTSALLTFPFVKLYVLATGSTGGIVLFTRHLYVAFVMLTTAVVFSSLRAFLRWPPALLISSICLVFIPFNIPNLSYNSMGAGFFAMGCFLGLKVIGAPRGAAEARPCRPVSLVFAGLCHALAVVAYPTIIVAAIAYMVALISLLERRRNCLYYVAGAVPVVLGVVWVLSLGGLDGVLESLRYTQTRPVGGGFGKLVGLVNGLGTSLSRGWLTLVLGGLIVFLARRGSRWALCLLVLLPLTALRARFPFGAPKWSMGVVLHLGLLSMFFYAFVRRGVFRSMFLLVCVPSVVAGLALSYTSGNGFISAGLGLLPAALTGLVFLAAAVSDMAGRNRSLVSLSLGAIVLALCFSQYTGFYREDRYSSLVAPVHDGPYAGLYTSTKRQREIAALQGSLRGVIRPSDRRIFFYGFPAGYLFTDLRPAARSLWTDRIDLDDTLRYFRSGNQPAVIVENTGRGPFRNERLTGPTRDERLKGFLVESGYALVAAVEGFEIYRSSRQ